MSRYQEAEPATVTDYVGARRRVRRVRQAGHTAIQHIRNQDKLDDACESQLQKSLAKMWLAVLEVGWEVMRPKGKRPTSAQIQPWKDRAFAQVRDISSQCYATDEAYEDLIQDTDSQIGLPDSTEVADLQAFILDNWVELSSPGR